MLTAYSAVNVDAIPTDAKIIFAYANPPFAQIEQVRARVPSATILPIVTHPDYMGVLYDFERGALPPNNAGSVIREALNRGLEHPAPYFSRADHDTVMASLHAHRIPRSVVRLVVAIGTDPWTYPPWADGVQALREIGGHSVNVYHLADDFRHWKYDRTRRPIG